MLCAPDGSLWFLLLKTKTKQPTYSSRQANFVVSRTDTQGFQTRTILFFFKLKSYTAAAHHLVKSRYLFTSMTIVVTTAARNTNAPNTPNAIIAPVLHIHTTTKNQRYMVRNYRLQIILL